MGYAGWSSTVDGSNGAMATGRWCREWLWTTSNASASGPARAIISRRWLWWSRMNPAEGIETSCTAWSEGLHGSVGNAYSGSPCSDPSLAKKVTWWPRLRNRATSCPTSASSPPA